DCAGPDNRAHRPGTPGRRCGIGGGVPGQEACGVAHAEQEHADEEECDRCAHGGQNSRRSPGDAHAVPGPEGVGAPEAGCPAADCMAPAAVPRTPAVLGRPASAGPRSSTIRMALTALAATIAAFIRAAATTTGINMPTTLERPTAALNARRKASALVEDRYRRCS